MVWGAQCYSRRCCTRTFAEIGIVTFWFYYPVIPAHICERNIKTFPAALIKADVTIYRSFSPPVCFSAFRMWMGIENDERFMRIVSRNWGLIFSSVTSFADQADFMDLRFVKLDPFLCQIWNVNFCPTICNTEFFQYISNKSSQEIYKCTKKNLFTSFAKNIFGVDISPYLINPLRGFSLLRFVFINFVRVFWIVDYDYKGSYYCRFMFYVEFMAVNSVNVVPRSLTTVC